MLFNTMRSGIIYTCVHSAMFDWNVQKTVNLCSIAFEFVWENPRVVVLMSVIKVRIGFEQASHSILEASFFD